MLLCPVIREGWTIPTVGSPVSAMGGTLEEEAQGDTILMYDDLSQFRED